ncbi:putative armadillo-like helical, 26S proteasome non-ATPase regulatory subunit 5 [Helianthus annuus]|nr:putative armadillo-like helical, 26S proteasome non-ATPase regulatory subunit 5 [Helianthus annuus]KAJ0474871.1 putative armadillo-like helical, 26S proteasome non-ATPase regulatory subunit 5 [Helianthus annuus]KAJ0650427.1 putative armadillo-like helical, 26S proteasome non-ATPase regulatory subunit 5 [Helianthus annuus]
MEEEYSLADTSKLLQAASDFCSNPGTRSEAAVKEFLNFFPLPVIISALQTKGDVAGVEDALVDCLEKIFKTKYGASLIPHFMPFIVVGLQAYSQKVRALSCKTISSLLENLDDNTGLATSLIKENDVYPLLLNCLVDGYSLKLLIFFLNHAISILHFSKLTTIIFCFSDEQVAVAATDAIRNLAGSQQGIEVIFPSTPTETTDITKLAARCSSLGRVRVLALIVKLFSTSSTAATLVYNSNLLGLFEAEIRNAKDTLITLSVLELYYELAEVQHGMEYVLQTNILQLLISIIRNSSAESMLRSRAMMISGRLLSKENLLTLIDESGVKAVISAIDERISLLESQDTDEYECALEALGQIGSSSQGAVLLLSNTSAAKHVVNAAFDLHGRGRQLAALHSLGNIVGETRIENNKLLSSDAEETLRRLIYETASNSPKLIPSGLVLAILKLESEFRVAGYRLITGLSARPWFLVEICSRQEIINIITDSYTETTKIGMEARYNCCEATYKALASSSKFLSDPALSGTAEKLLETIKKGPYLTKGRKQEARPEVATADRF